MAPKSPLKTKDPSYQEGGRKNGRVNGKRGGRAGAGVVTEQQIAYERSVLLNKRQSELEGILDQHDTLVSFVCYLPMMNASDSST